MSPRTALPPSASDALSTRFAADLAATLGHAPTRDAPLLLAVSGGPDSLALLLLGAAAFPGAMRAATVDHGLRAAAADEARLVADACAALGVPHDVLTVTVASGASIQAQARAARYDALASHAATLGCTAIATAHHADDQAETLLMRAARGSGVNGLASVRAMTRCNDVAVVRPLLGWRRAELAEVVDAAGLVAADDPTNRDPAHDRTRFRALLASAPLLDPAGLARSAATLADVSDALSWSVAHLAETRLTGDQLNVADLPREYRRRLLLLALARHGESPPRGPAIDIALDLLDSGRKAPLGDTLVCPNGTVWRFSPAPPRRSR